MKNTERYINNISFILGKDAVKSYMKLLLERYRYKGKCMHDVWVLTLYTVDMLLSMANNPYPIELGPFQDLNNVYQKGGRNLLYCHILSIPSESLYGLFAASVISYVRGSS